MSTSSNMSDGELETTRGVRGSHEPSMEEILASIRSIIADDRETARAAQMKFGAQRVGVSSGPQIVYPTYAKLGEAEEIASPAAEAPMAEPGAPKIVWRRSAATVEPPHAPAPSSKAEAVSAKAEPRGAAEAAKREGAAATEPDDAPAEKAPQAAAPEPAVIPQTRRALKPADAEPQAGAWGDPVIAPQSGSPGEAEPAAAQRPARNRRVDASALPEPLLSSATEAMVASSFNALLAARIAEVADQMVRDLLRPMLKTWLDQNLPAIVEKLVAAEIERISRIPL